MGLKADLEENVSTTFKSAWDVRTGTYVPEPKDVGFANKAVLLENAVVLYADLRASTAMVDNYKWEFSAEIYKTFLHCAGKIVKNRGATITAYDGDRIMAIFIGDDKCDNAARASLEINWAVINIIMPAMKNGKWKDPNFVLNHTVGIDMSDLRAARTGVRIDNDLVWVGKAANHAAKLTEENFYRSWITQSVYEGMTDFTKIASNGTLLWNCSWNSMINSLVYGSNGWWTID